MEVIRQGQIGGGEVPSARLSDVLGQGTIRTCVPVVYLGRDDNEATVRCAAMT